LRKFFTLKWAIHREYTHAQQRQKTKDGGQKTEDRRGKYEYRTRNYEVGMESGISFGSFDNLRINFECLVFSPSVPSSPLGACRGNLELRIGREVFLQRGRKRRQLQLHL